MNMRQWLRSSSWPSFFFLFSGLRGLREKEEFLSLNDFRKFINSILSFLVILVMDTLLHQFSRSLAVLDKINLLKRYIERSITFIYYIPFYYYYFFLI